MPRLDSSCPSGRAWVLLGPILPSPCTGLGERGGGERGWLLTQHLLTAVAAGVLVIRVRCGAPGVQALLRSQFPRLCLCHGAFNVLGKSSCDSGTAVIWGCPFGPH